MSDIEIARKANKKNIKEIASTLNLDEKVLHPFGHYIAKINIDANKAISNKDVHLFLCPSAPERIGDKATDYTVAYGINENLYEEFVLAGYFLHPDSCDPARQCFWSREDPASDGYEPRRGHQVSGSHRHHVR